MDYGLWNSSMHDLGKKKTIFSHHPIVLSYYYIYKEMYITNSFMDCTAEHNL